MPDHPAYRKQTSPNGDRAFVEVHGRRRYLGLYGTPESRRRYKQLCAELDANGGRLAVDASEITVAELLLRFLDHAEAHYKRPDGTHTSELANYKALLAVMNDLYADDRVTEFGPLALKACREVLIKKGWTRQTVNQSCSRIRHIFRWAVENELCPETVWRGLQAVSGLRAGRSEAKEGVRVRALTGPAIEAVKPHVGPIIWAMIEVQRYTAMRAGELVIMRPCDLDRSGAVWLYKPTDHKTAWHGHERTVYIGPKAQAALAPLLFRDPGAFIFNPKESEKARYRKARVHRRAKQKPNPKETNRELGNRYTVDSYRRCIERACAKAGITEWTPHRLRHTAATEIRRQFGLDAARILLGHRSPRITEVYAELDKAKGIQAAELVG